MVRCVDVSVGMFYFFFFFQAEDGIRDVAVTGVQTCALPIYHRGQRGPRNRAGAARTSGRGGRLWQRDQPPAGRRPDRGRSGERRVGEEGRSRWGPDHLKKKKKKKVIYRNIK